MALASVPAGLFRPLLNGIALFEPCLQCSLQVVEMHDTISIQDRFGLAHASPIEIVDQDTA